MIHYRYSHKMICFSAHPVGFFSARGTDEAPHGITFAVAAATAGSSSHGDGDRLTDMIGGAPQWC